MDLHSHPRETVRFRLQDVETVLAGLYYGFERIGKRYRTVSYALKTLASKLSYKNFRQEIVNDVKDKYMYLSLVLVRITSLRHHKLLWLFRKPLSEGFLRRNGRGKAMVKLEIRYTSYPNLRIPRRSMRGEHRATPP